MVTRVSVRRELATIAKEVGKGLIRVLVFKKSPKPKWCQCNKCGQWHFLAK